MYGDGFRNSAQCGYDHADFRLAQAGLDANSGAAVCGRVSREHAKLDRRRWAWARRKILNRDNWRCQPCGRYGNEVDHIQPLQKGGDPWAEIILQCLCKQCHIAKTRAEFGGPRDPAREGWETWSDELQFAGRDRK